MKQKIFTSLAIVFFMTPVAEKTFAQNTAAPENGNTNETIELFNGRNLEGWYTFLKGYGRNNDPKDVFNVEDGLIHISGEEWGCITTVGEYEDYKLVVEFKWGDKTFGSRKNKARDSGILVHSQGEDGGYKGTWMHSIEVQIIEGGTGDFIVVDDGSDKFSVSSSVAPEKQGSSYIFKPGGDPATVNGRINWFGRDPDWQDVKGFRGEEDVERAVGEWNKIEVIAIDDNILTFLNGILVNEAYDVKPSKGKIQIQSEGARMFLRRVELTPLLEK